MTKKHTLPDTPLARWFKASGMCFKEFQRLIGFSSTYSRAILEGIARIRSCTVKKAMAITGLSEEDILESIPPDPRLGVKPKSSLHAWYLKSGLAYSDIAQMLSLKENTVRCIIGGWYATSLQTAKAFERISGVPAENIIAQSNIIKERNNKKRALRRATKGDA